MRFTGTVKWFDRSRGFGVIGRARGETDCFVRHSAIRGTVCNALDSGDPVEFDVMQGGAGAVARDVIRLAFSFIPAFEAA
jgi:cold shock CspA family protein